MPKRPNTHAAILAEVARGGERSSLFWWLVEHHDDLIQQSVGRRMRWAPLSALFAQHGLTNVRGVQASPDTARETWKRARRFVAAANARQAEERERERETVERPGKTPPSRISPDWRPQVVPARELVPAIASPTPGATASPTPGRALVRAWPPADEERKDWRFPESDDAGRPLEKGHVFHLGRSMPQEEARLMVLARLVEALPTVDPAGAPLPDGFVFFNGRPYQRFVAQAIVRGRLEANLIDRHK